jgi:hypothetical protein
MTNLFIHIGPHKTLSTLIQAIFAELLPNSQLASPKSIVYPLYSSDKNLNHSRLANSSIGIENYKSDPNCIERFIVEHGLENHSVLLSAENFCKDIENDFNNLYLATRFAYSLTFIVAEREYSKRSVGIVNELILNQDVTPNDFFLLSNPSTALTYSNCKLNYVSKLCKTFKGRVKEIIVMDFRGKKSVLASLTKLFEHMSIPLSPSQKLKLDIMCSHRVNEGMHHAHREMLINIIKTQKKKVPHDEWRLMCSRIRSIDPSLISSTIIDMNVYSKTEAMLSDLDEIQNQLFIKSLDDNNSLTRVI